MKIIRRRQDDDGNTVTDVIGLRCDSCGDEARHQISGKARSLASVQEAITASLQVGDYVCVDLNTGASVSRADLCRACSSRLFQTIRSELQAFRNIATQDPAHHYMRRYRFSVVDGESGRAYEVYSVFDEDLHLGLLGE